MKERHLADLARTILKDPTVKVTFGGQDSYFTHETDKQGNKIVHINIAKMEATPTGVLLMCGLVFHEIGHKHTDGGKSQGMLGDLENIIEDVRTEQLTIKDRPGASFDLEAMINHYLGKGSLEPEDLAHALRGKAMAYGRGRILSQKAMLALEDACNEMLDDAFGQSFIDEIEDILQGYANLKSTDDARIMAKKLIDLLIHQQQQQQNQQQQQQQQSQSQSQQQQQGAGGSGSAQEDSQDGQGDQSQDQNGDNQSQQDGNGKSQGQDQQQDADGDSGTGKTDSSSDQNGEADGSDSDDSDDASQDSDANQGSGAGGCGKMPTPEEIEEMLNQQTGYGDFGQLMKDELDELADQTTHASGALEIPEWPVLGRLTRKYRPLDESESMAASSRMRSRLGSLLFSSKRMPVTHSSSGRKLNTNKLVRMMTAGDPKIFQRKIEEAAPNSAVVIVNDTSGSMEDYGRWIVANKAAFALNSCLYSLTGVKCATVEFSTKDRNDGSYADVNLVCDFGAKPKSDTFNIPPFSGTPTDQAIWVARGMLLQRPEPRKIMLIVTDGEPNCPSSTVGATRRTLKDGIEIAAIGIQSEEVQCYWKNNRVIHSISDLPTAMFGMMEELLIRRPGGIS